MNTDPRDYQLDIRSADIELPTFSPAAGTRKYLRVMFACCQVYSRVYQSRDGTHYDARCPKCSRSLKFNVGPGGTDERTFVLE